MNKLMNENRTSIPFTSWHASISGRSRAISNVDDDLKICETANPSHLSDLCWERRKVATEKGHDACACELHQPTRRWRCAFEEAVDLGLGVLNSMVEHLHATRQDLCGQNPVTAASMGSPDPYWRWLLDTRSFRATVSTFVIHTLGWFLVATKDLSLDINELRR